VRTPPRSVIDQEDAALDHSLAEIQGQACPRRFQAGAREIQRAADPRAYQAQFPARRELVEQPDVPADMYAVGLNRAFSATVNDGIHAQQPAPDLRLTQLDR
jgi:hypothetical protein